MPDFVFGIFFARCVICEEALVLRTFLKATKTYKYKTCQQ